MGSFLRNKKIIIIAAAVLLATAAAMFIVILTNGKKGYRNISVTEVAGTVTVGKDGKEYSAYENMHLADGNSLSTLIESFIRFSLDDEKYVKLDEESRAVFMKIGSSSKKTAIELEYGTLVTELTKPLTTDESFVVNTPNSVLAVRGTFFRIYTSVGEDGIVYTDIYTYGGSVAVQRVLPDGTVVEEQVTVDVGYKTRIKMDAAETVYVTEVIDGNSENVYPIDPSEIPDDDIVAMYNASRNGHGLFMSTGELWREIENRNIDINEYTSVYDGKKIPPYDGAAEKPPVSSSASTPEQPAEHIHNPVTNVTGATCTENGRATTVCLDCGEVISDNESPAFGHDWERISAQPAACTEDGHTAYSKCANCGETKDYGVIEAAGHDWESISAQPAACTKDGHTAYSKCANCGETKDYGVIEATGHDWKEFAAQPATCTKDGHTAYSKCANCGETKDYGVIEATGHDWQRISAQTAACTEDGHTAYSKCANCGETKDYGVIEATGHEWERISAQPATCTKDGHTAYSQCATCGETKDYGVIEATGHEWERISAQPATCTEDGHTAYSKCANCGETKDYGVIEATGHDWKEFAAQPAACTEDGHTAYSKCANCGETKDYGVIEATGHEWERISAQPATCTEDGHTAYSKCANCGETKDYEVIEATGHEWERISAQPATCVDEGYELYRCSHCGDDKTVTLPVDPDAHLPQRPEYPAEMPGDLYIYWIYCDRALCGAFLGKVEVPYGSPLPDDYILHLID